MYAIIETGGKQYSVEEGKVLYIEKIEANQGDTYVFENVSILLFCCSNIFAYFSCLFSFFLTHNSR